MGSLLWLGYPGASANVLTTELNALDSTYVSVLSAEQDNSTNKYMFADFQVNLATLAVASGGFVQVFVIPSVDGSTYPDWPGAKAAFADYMGQYARGSALVQPTSAAHVVNIEEVRIPPGKYKIALRNACGVNFNATTNTLAQRTYSGSYT